MEKACAGDEKLKVHAAKCKYPQGGERSIIQVIAGIDLKLGMLPADAGCVVDQCGDHVCHLSGCMQCLRH